MLEKPPTGQPPAVQYGLSQSSHMMLLIGFLCFVLGGVFSVIGVVSDQLDKSIGGLVVMVVGIGVYTCTIMFANVSGPPSGFNLQGISALSQGQLS